MPRSDFEGSPNAPRCATLLNIAQLGALFYKQQHQRANRRKAQCTRLGKATAISLAHPLVKFGWGLHQGLSMIELYDGTRLETLASWDELTSRPGFRSNLNVAEFDFNKLKVLGVYHRPTLVTCGLKSCHRPHYKGYVIALDHGVSTNIGHCCGERHSLNWKAETRTFERDMLNRQRRDQIIAAQARLPTMLARVKVMSTAPFGALWALGIESQLRARGKGLPDAAVAAISVAVKARDGTLYREVEVDARTVALQEQAAPGRRVERFVRRSVGVLLGIEALYPENDLKKSLGGDMSLELETLGKLDAASASDKELDRHCQWIDGFERRLGDAQSTLDSFRSLASAENLRQLVEMMESPADREAVLKFCRALDQARNSSVSTRLRAA